MTFWNWLTRRRDDHGWPGYVINGRIRTSTVALVVAFFVISWVHNTYQPAAQTPVVPESAQVVPPGFMPDPQYTWVPRTNVEQRPRITSSTPTTTTPTTTKEPSPTETTTTTPTSPTSPTSPTETTGLAPTTFVDPDGAGPLPPTPVVSTSTPPTAPSTTSTIGAPPIPGPGPVPTPLAPPR
jgi:hypothetical protein